MEHPNQKPQGVKCPKGMKLPKAVKSLAASMHNLTKTQRRDFMKNMGVAIHDAAIKARQTSRADRQAAVSMPPTA